MAPTDPSLPFPEPDPDCTSVEVMRRIEMLFPDIGDWPGRQA